MITSLLAPLTPPVAPAFGDRMMMTPVVASVLYPLAIDTAPPLLMATALETPVVATPLLVDSAPEPSTSPDQPSTDTPPAVPAVLSPPVRVEPPSAPLWDAPPWAETAPPAPKPPRNHHYYTDAHAWDHVRVEPNKHKSAQPAGESRASVRAAGGRSALG